MNLVLLDPRVIDDRGEALVEGRRARHLVQVLGAAPGRVLRAGVVDGPLGTAEVLECSGGVVRLRITLEDRPPPRPEDMLLLAVPRPKVLGRMLEHAAALGFGAVHLFRSWRVDKSHLQAKVLGADRLREHLWAGLEQGQRTWMPAVSLAPLFKPFVEDEVGELVRARHGFVADPGARRGAAACAPGDGRALVLALGPERGFTEYEVAAFAAQGFVPVHCGPHPLRTETALPFLYGLLSSGR